MIRYEPVAQYGVNHLRTKRAVIFAFFARWPPAFLVGRQSVFMASRLVFRFKTSVHQWFRPLALCQRTFWPILIMRNGGQKRPPEKQKSLSLQILPYLPQSAQISENFEEPPRPAVCRCCRISPVRMTDGLCSNTWTRAPASS